MNYLKAFDFIKNKKLKNILVLDCKEFLTALKRQCPKAAVVLSGGITEAILKDLGRKKKNRINVEAEYKKISKNKKKKRVEDMDLYYLIKTLENLKLISSVDASVSNILRDYRNMIHPFKYLKRPTKQNAKLTKQLLDNLLENKSIKGKNIGSNEKKGELFFIEDYYKKRREKEEYKKTIEALFKNKKTKFNQIKSLEIFQKKSNPGKSAAPILGYLRFLGICDYDKKSWQDTLKRYDVWIFNKKFNSLAREYLK